MQVQNPTNHQPIIISTASLQNQLHNQQQTILQMAQSPQTTGVFLNTSGNDE